MGASADRRGSRSTISAWIPYLLGLLTGLLGGAALPHVLQSSTPDEELYRSVRDLVQATFVEEVDADTLLDEALQGMVGSLDPYSRYYRPEELADLDRETSGTFTGIGVVFKPPSSERRVLFPVPGSPADGRIAVGDRILALDGLELSDLAPGELASRMSDKRGRSVAIDLESRHGARRTEQLVPAQIVDPTVRHGALLDPERGIAYLAVLSFSNETPGEFDAEVEHLAAAGMRSLVVDLRGNPGGVLSAAVALANRFVADGDIVVTRAREGAHAYRADPAAAALLGTPLVLLVDGASASASEVLAGAVQDHRAGVLVGEPTYGKGMVQTLQPFGERAVVKLTTALYTTPANRQIDRFHTSECAAGIDPDLLVPLGKTARDRIHAHLGSYSPPHELLTEIETWEREEQLDLLPEWPADPQRDAAAALLAGTPLVGAEGEL